MGKKRTTDEFLIQVKADIDQATRELRKLTGQLEKTDQAGNKGGQSLQGMSRGMRSLIGVASAYLSLHMARRLIEQADAWNTLQARIRTATRETGDYNQVAAELYRITQSNGAAMDTTVALFQGLARVAPELGATNREMLQLTNTVQQLGVISGTTRAQQRAGLLQFTQGLASGVFRAEEFNSLLENLPELANRIAKGMGLTVGQLRQMVLEGKVLSKDVFEALRSQTDDIERQFREMPDNLQRSGQALENSWSNFLSYLDQSLNASQTLAKIYRGIANDLDLISGAGSIDDYTQAIRELEAENQKLIENPSWWKNEEALIDRNLKKIQEYRQHLDEIKRQQAGALGEFGTGEETVRGKGKSAPPPSPPSDKEKQREQQRRYAEYETNLRNLVAQLDPAAEAARQIEEKIALLDQAMFRGDIDFEQYDKYVESILGAADAAQEAAESYDEMDRAMELIDEQFKQLDEDEARQIAGLKKVEEKGKKTFDTLEAAARGWGNAFTDTLVDMVMTGKASFKDLADSVIRDLLRMMVFKNLTKPLFSAFDFEIKHGGGLVGNSGTRRQAFAYAFAGAPRYHSGGIAGLAPNEVPAILQAGEEVLTRDDPRHVANRGAGGSVKVEVVNENTPIEASNAEVSFDGEGMVVRVFTRDLKSGGPISRQLQSTYRLKR